MLDDWIRLWDIDVIWDVDFFVVWNMNLFDMGNSIRNFLDDSQNLLFVMMELGLMVRDFVMVTIILAAVAVATSKIMTTEVMTTEIMIVQASLVLLFARFSFDDWLLFVLSLFLRGNA